MRKGQFTDEHIIRVRHEWEAGAKLADLVRKHGVTEHALYRWKKNKDGGDAGE
jgi:putative transposase